MSATLPAGAAADCVENPKGPDNWELGGCKTCAAGGESCEECWDFFGLASDGHCKRVRRNASRSTFLWGVLKQGY